jgi:hypothetical protein
LLGKAMTVAASAAATISGFDTDISVSGDGGTGKEDERDW